MLASSTKWKINGTPIYAPSSFTVSMEDLEVSAERTADGMLHRERARQGVRKVSFRYDTIEQAELQRLLPLLAGVFFNLTYPDPEKGGNTIECYCSKKNGELYSALYFNGLWRNVQFNCIER